MTYLQMMFFEKRLAATGIRMPIPFDGLVTDELNLRFPAGVPLKDLRDNMGHSSDD